MNVGERHAGKDRLRSRPAASEQCRPEFAWTQVAVALDGALQRKHLRIRLKREHAIQLKSLQMTLAETEAHSEIRRTESVFHNESF